MMFDNTKVAFLHRTNKELIIAKYMFKLVSYAFLIKIGNRLLRIAVFLKLPVSFLLKPTIYRQFIGGESIEKCKTNVEKLAEYNIKSVLDYSVEGSATEESFEKTYREILNSIIHASSNKDIPFSVFKFSGIVDVNILEKLAQNIRLSSNETEAYNAFLKRFDGLCKAAYSNDIPLLIDAEESWYQAPIDKLVIDNMLKYNKKKAIIFNTYQLYLKSSLSNLISHAETVKRSGRFFGVKIVRGAYLEKENLRAKIKNYPTPIFETKQLTDQAFDEALNYCVKNLDHIYLFSGTHNEESTKKLIDLMKEYSIEKTDERVYFSQLFGMSDHISFNLSTNGYNVCKYVPYGGIKDVVPYLIRRAEENSSVRGQTGRELFLIKKELRRRKKN